MPREVGFGCCIKPPVDALFAKPVADPIVDHANRRQRLVAPGAQLVGDHTDRALGIEVYRAWPGAVAVTAGERRQEQLRRARALLCKRKSVGRREMGVVDKVNGRHGIVG